LWEIAPLFSDGVRALKVEVIPGACMLLRREVFEQVGGFSEDYFMYAEDLDLNYKLKAGRFSNYYVGETAIIHHGGKSSSRQQVSHWATVMKYRAMVRLFHKTRGGWYAFLYRITMGAVATGRLALMALISPLANLVWDREALRLSSGKWKSVLVWAVGGQEFAKDCRELEKAEV
jgi:GT2 family glycosyltransferase